MSLHSLCCEQLFDGFRWYSPGYIQIRGGIIEAVGSAAPAVVSQQLAGLTLPGVPNLHSHAFQRALAGLTERQSASRAEPEQRDSFWTWRELMYGFVAKLGPDDVEAIAEQVYVEMLEAGYTSVAEFHYLHHDPSGAPYADPAELGRRVAAAARAVGMRMTLLPVYYETAGFGSQPLQPRQRRFYNTRDQFLSMHERLLGEQDSLISVGIAPHSLRAVPLDGLRDVVLAAQQRRADGVIHLHIAEQLREVAECQAHHAARPVELLFEQQAVDQRWCLVHATQLSASEITLLAKSRAVAGLCPTTEANLGDGLFSLLDYLAQGGRLGVGSDSQITVSPDHELRLLEYGQRLSTQRRNVAVAQRPSYAHSGEFLLSEALLGGGQALGTGAGRLSPGCPADLVVLDHEHPSLLARSGPSLLDSWIFASNRPAIARTMVGGEWLVEAGRHHRRAPVQARFLKAMTRLLS